MLKRNNMHYSGLADLVSTAGFEHSLDCLTYIHIPFILLGINVLDLQVTVTLRFPRIKFL